MDQPPFSGIWVKSRFDCTTCNKVDIPFSETRSVISKNKYWPLCPKCQGELEKVHRKTVEDYLEAGRVFKATGRKPRRGDTIDTEDGYVGFFDCECCNQRRNFWEMATGQNEDEMNYCAWCVAGLGPRRLECRDLHLLEACQLYVLAYTSYKMSPSPTNNAHLHVLSMARAASLPGLRACPC